MQPWQIALLAVGITFVCVAAFAFLYLYVLPRAIVHKMRTSPNPDGEMTFPDNFDALRDQTTFIRDLSYPSAKPDNRYNLYLPKHTEAGKKYPLIIWIHGGGFIGGTKDGGDNVMISLCASGYAVASIDYAVAPEHKYPTAIHQIHEFVCHLPDICSRYPGIDATRLVFGGDSAGAQLAAQYVTIQTCKPLSDEMNIPQTIQKQIKAILLVCGPFDLPAIRKYAQKSNKLLRWLVDVWGRAYFGKIAWYRSKKASQTIISEHITTMFPPAFLTDGNKGSFEIQNKKLAKKLNECGIPIRELYFDPVYGDIPHEYLFHLHEQSAQLCMQQMIDFLKEFLQESRVC